MRLILRLCGMSLLSVFRGVRNAMQAILTPKKLFARAIIICVTLCAGLNELMKATADSCSLIAHRA